MTPEQKLERLLGRATPPARDVLFQAAVAERIARRRAWLSVVALTPFAVVAAVMLWALGPALADLAPAMDDSGTAPMGGLVGAGLLAVGTLWLTRRLSVAR